MKSKLLEMTTIVYSVLYRREKNMKRIPKAIVNFLGAQSFVLVSTVSKQGLPHTVPKGIALVQSQGLIYVVDLYHGTTWRNLKNNRHITLCCVDERHFRGYQLKGTARVYKITEAHEALIKLWRKKVSARITSRLIENVLNEKKTHHHEAYFPPPKTIIEINVNKIISLTTKK
jgi:predicted pyridoxine 5'-phosphate oxidase superfamily flavin-nucleotide-binding protein